MAQVQRDREIENQNVQTRGIIINNMYKWVNCNSKANVEVLARAMDIIWGSDCRYWIYKKEQFKGETIEVAELLNVCWLNVQGSHDTTFLSECTEYEVLFDIKLNPCASGWCEPVNFILTTPNGCEKKCQLKLDHYIGKGYVEIPIGKFTNSGSCGSKHNVDFKMYEHGGHWKKGLIVRGVIIRAIN